jgi:peptide deformylase
MTNLKNPCPCGSGKEYDQCCQVFHKGHLPKNALLLMRSRYSAYVLNIPDYIIETTHPASAQYSENKFSWKRRLSQFSRSSSFHKLEILDFKEKNPMATVTFTVYLSQDGHESTFTERSYFQKINHRWFYEGGVLTQGHDPNLVTTGPLRLLPLAYYGDPILRKIAEPITEITSDIQTLIEDMIETMDTYDGMGLAAPQIHHSIRLFVIRTPIETEQDQLKLGEVKVFINPKLSLPSDETWKAPEACLSIPTIRSLVERPKEVTVEHTSLEGQLIKQRYSGWEAKVIMHENDHIEGTLFIDQLDQEEQSKLKPFLQKLEKRIHGRISTI